jgi:hypothetical protein
MVILLLACSGEPEETPEAVVDPIEVLVKASIDLRGVRPSIEELEAVEQNPAKLEEYFDSYLEDPRFEGRVADLFQEIFLTRNDAYLITASQYGLSDQAAFSAAIGDEVPRIIGHIAAEDLPYTEVVMGDWTMANEILGQIWPNDYPEGGSGWQKVHYTDGRPPAGVLATNSLWWRYTSTDSNANRKRANAISRTLLCNDYLSRPIEFDRNVNLLDEGAVADALKTNPACVNCHVSLDPIASYLFGFWWYDYTNPGEASYYFPEREPRWKDYTETEPAWYGEAGYTLENLGHQIAGDARFPACVTTEVYSLLLRRDLTIKDDNALIPHRNALIDSGMKLKALFRSVLQDPAYQSNRKIPTPELLASQVEELTGFHWTYQGYDLMRSDSVGFLTLAGGADGYNVTEPASSPNTTAILVQERLAEAASWYLIKNGPEKLFSLDISVENTAEERAKQLQALHWRLYGNRVEQDSEEVQAALLLWDDLYAVDQSPQNAWAGVLSILLRDPDFLLY